jgi:hypothetical protein
MYGRGSGEITIMKMMETRVRNNGNNRSDQEHIVPIGNSAKTDRILHIWHIENNRFLLCLFSNVEFIQLEKRGREKKCKYLYRV